MDARQPSPGGVVVDGGRIVAVGDRDLLRSYPDAAIEELAGRILIPGLIDAHHHLSIAALHPCWADLSGVRSLEELQRALAGQAARFPEAGWVRGAGWNEHASGVVPHRRDLDELGLERPVIVACYTLHQCVVDSRGLDLLGITRQTPDPPDGTIGRDRDGEPNGLLVERAWSGAHARSLEAYSDPDRWADHIAARAGQLLVEGITCVHDAACSPQAEAVYRGMRESGQLPLSVLTMPHPMALLAGLATDRLDGPPTGEGDEMLRVGPVKLFADGGVAPAISATYRGAPMVTGMRFGGLEEEVRVVTERGFRVAVHAIGNAGLESALDAFDGAARLWPGRDHRFRVEHATLASAEQLSRLSALDGVAVVQPGFLDHMGKMVEGVELDDASWLPFGELARSGAGMAASSDAPCTFDDPIRCAAHGVSRVTGSGKVLSAGQSVPFDDWLRAYTIGAAYAGGQEHERGSLSAGKRADLVVLEGDLDPEHPPRVVQTWVAGELVAGSR